jgi:hypothetical protein
MQQFSKTAGTNAIQSSFDWRDTEGGTKRLGCGTFRRKNDWL